MSNSILEIENPKYVWIYPKGIKIMKSDGFFVFAIHRKGSKDVLMEVSEKELFQVHIEEPLYFSKEYIENIHSFKTLFNK